MKFDITKRMEVVDRAIEATTNPFHKAILENYRRHANLEVCGLYEKILSPDMVVKNPLYKIHIGEQMLIAEGIEEVSKIYHMMVDTGSTVIFHTDEHIMVNDEGLMTDYISHRFWPGRKLMEAQGIDLPNPDGNYVVEQSIICFFPYDRNALLAGEVVYHGADMKIRECPPEEFISVDEAREKLLPLMKSPEDYRYVPA